MKELLARKLVEHAVAKDEVREVLTVAYYNQELGEIVAVDGFRMVVVKVEPFDKPFPNYRILVPDSKHILSTVEVDIKDLFNIASLFMNTKCTSIRLILEDKYIKCCSGSKTQIEENIIYSEAYLPFTNVAGRKKDTKVAVNPRYLLDTARALKNIKGLSKCKISICSPSEPILIKAGDYTEVVMPMYVKWGDDGTVDTLND